MLTFILFFMTDFQLSCFHFLILHLVPLFLLNHIKTRQLKIQRTVAKEGGAWPALAVWHGGQYTLLAVPLVSVPCSCLQAFRGSNPTPLYPFSFSISMGQILLWLSLISISSMRSQRLMICRENPKVWGRLGELLQPSAGPSCALCITMVLHLAPSVKWKSPERTCF